MPETHLQHKHLLIHSYCNNPIIDPDIIRQWLLDLVNKINMKVLDGPIAKYCDMKGNEGVSAAVIIETSHIVIHTWSCDGSVQLDVYSCKDVDKDIIFQHLKVMQPIKTYWKFLDRELDFKEICE